VNSLFRLILAVAAVVGWFSFGDPTPVFAQCTGQFLTLTVCGNPTGSTALPIAMSKTQLTGLVNIATTLAPGIVQPDGTTITINGSGVITAVGAGGITVGGTITGSCTSGYVIFNNSGVIGCEPAGSASAITVGSTTVGGSTSGYVLYNNSGTLGNVANNITINGQACALGST
jgi:hypothetical protein